MTDPNQYPLHHEAYHGSYKDQDQLKTALHSVLAANPLDSLSREIATAIAALYKTKNQ